MERPPFSFAVDVIDGTGRFVREIDEYCSFDFESVVCDFTYQAHDPLQGGETFDIEDAQPRTMGC